MSFLRSSPKHISTIAPESKQAEKPAPLNILIPFGMLLDELDHTLSVGAFDALAKKEDKANNWPTLLPLVLKADAKFKAGGKDSYTETTFIAELRSIFALTEITKDEEIRKAWNAMLGDLSKLSAIIDNLIARNKDKKIILMSGTNPIHFTAIQHALGNEKSAAEANPFNLRGIPYYVSFLQKAQDEKLRCTDTNLVEEIMAEQTLDPKNTVLLLSLTSNSKILKKAEEAGALRRKEWAETTKGMTTLDFNRNNKLSVADAIDAYVATRAEKQKAQNVESNSPSHLFYNSAVAAAAKPLSPKKPEAAKQNAQQTTEPTQRPGL
jgi:hypothetical protein